MRLSLLWSYSVLTLEEDIFIIGILKRSWTHGLSKVAYKTEKKPKKRNLSLVVILKFSLYESLWSSAPSFIPSPSLNNGILARRIVRPEFDIAGQCAIRLVLDSLPSASSASPHTTGGIVPTAVARIGTLPRGSRAHQQHKLITHWWRGHRPLTLLSSR